MVRSQEPAHPSQPEDRPVPMPITITGMAYRLPGPVSTEDEFWSFCCNAKSTWSEVPANRFNASAYYHPDPDKLGYHEVEGGYFLKEDVARFNAAFFGISTEEARAMDPQQHLLLECAYEALENAGVCKDSLVDQTMAIYVGGTTLDYEHHTYRDTEQIPRYNVTRNNATFLSSRLSHFFDFKEPSLTVDTGCSSGLTALHLACQSLREGESTHALLGACHLNLLPETFISFSSNSLLNPSGRCHSFDAKATSGYGRGEGVVCVFLRPLDAAIEANDNILAVIANTGINQDGYTPTISGPSATAQEQLIRSVYASANIDPQDTGYLEAHGTGTQVGDPIEARALYNVFGKTRNAHEPLLIGSAKSKFGHTEGVSGLVALVKAVLMLHRGFIVPNSEDTKPRLDVPWDEWNLKISRKFMPWPIDKPYLGINNFGVGGANAHVVLCRTSHMSCLRQTRPLHFPVRDSIGTSRVFVLSGNSEEAVRRQATNLEIYLERHHVAFDSGLMYNLAYTLGERRARLPWKVATWARSWDDLREALSAKMTQPFRSLGKPNVALVFNGQGAQWYAMGRELLGDYPVFRATMEAVDRQLEMLGGGFSVIKEIGRSKEQSLVDVPHISQAVCTAVQMALTAMLSSWGVLPCAVLGHSSGEVAAAYAAGILSLEDATHITYARGQATYRLRDYPEVKGTMMAIGAPVQKVDSLLQRIQYGKASVACINSPQNVTVSGDVTAIDELCTIANQEVLFARRLRVDVAYHSPHMRLVADAFLEQIKTIRPQHSTVPFYSSTLSRRGQWNELKASYWVENLVGPVKFASNLDEALRTQQEIGSQIDLLVEVGPHPALASSIVEILSLSEYGKSVSLLGTLKRGINGTDSMHDLCSRLILKGLDIRMGNANLIRPDKVKPNTIIDLPRYPWDHGTRYWHSTRLGKNHLLKPFVRHELLGSLVSEYNDLEPQWRTVLNSDDHSWLKDYKVQGRTVFPVSALVVMAVEARRQLAILRKKTRFDQYVLRDVCTAKMLVVPDSTPVELITSIRSHSHGMRVPSSDWDEVHIFSWTEENGWDESFSALIRTEESLDGNELVSTQLSAVPEMKAIRSRCTGFCPSEYMYTELDQKGVQYDRVFRNLTDCFTDQGEAVASSVIPSAVEQKPPGLTASRMHPHPAILDYCIQTSWPILGAGVQELKTPYVPSSFDEIVLLANLDIQPGNKLSLYCKRTSPTVSGNTISFRAWASKDGSNGGPMIEFKGLTMTAVDNHVLSSEDNYAMKSYHRVQMETCFDFVPSAHLELKAGAIKGSKVVSSSLPLSTHLPALDEAALCLSMMIRQRPSLRVLEIGTSLSSTSRFLSLLPDDIPLQKYTFADVSGPSRAHEPPALGKWAKSVQVRTYGSLERLLDLRPEPESTDVVVITDIPFSRRLSQPLLSFARQGLVDGGKLIVATTGSCSGLGQECLGLNEWSTLLPSTGFSGVDISLSSYDTLDAGKVVISSTDFPNLRIDKPLVIVHNGDLHPSWLTLLGMACKDVTGDSPTIQHLNDSLPMGCISLFVGELQKPILGDMTPNILDRIKMLVQHSDGVLWVTRDAYIDCKDPSANLIAGLARTIRSELDMPFATLDVAGDSNSPSVQEAQAIASVFNIVFHQQSVLCAGDYEFSLRGGIISVPRVMSDNDLDETLQRMAKDSAEIQPLLQENRHLTLAMRDHGLIDSLYFTDAASPNSLPPSWVEIEVAAVGLNCSDIVHAQKPVNDKGHFGSGCSGVVKSAGRDATEFCVGDRVCAFAAQCFSTITRCPASCVRKISPGMSFEVAASIPSAFVTSIYCLLHTGHLQSSDRVLIHGAAGGFGQSAVMIAKCYTAQVYVTVGNAQMKSALMANHGIPDSHIFFSGDRSFLDGILAVTGGEGIDVVLNCVTGDLARWSVECLAPFGRFVDIGTQDITTSPWCEVSKLGRKNLSLNTVDLSAVAQQRPVLLQGLMGEVFELLDSGSISPVSPLNAFDASNVTDAFSLLHSKQSVGQVVVNFTKSSTVKVFPARIDPRFLRPDATYMVVGGGGDLGKGICTLLAKHGAKHIVIVSRRGSTADGVSELITTLGARDVNVRALSCDVSQPTAVQILLPYLRQSPPLRGAIFSAMVLQDAVFEHLTLDDWNASIGVKLHGIHNMNQVFSKLQCPLDFYVGLSSATGIVGNRAQSAYTAANTAIDAFPHYNKGQGLPFTSIALPLIWDKGRFANNLRKQELVAKRLAMETITENEFHTLLTAVIQPGNGVSRNSQILRVWPLGGDNTLPFWSGDARFCHIMNSLPERTDTANHLSVADALKRVRRRDDAISILTEGLADKLADSLSAIEVHKWVSRELETSLQLLEILTSPSLKALAMAIILL
ncbi:hypothetical protein FE257_006242 [Aspergillus nanangensis]|uniref:Carrier domain-containing protein n=1 Tax=Aspergillus nanangensis TaxID=2582783 RepID=A0AAD4GUU4_ASPNN|nr:hypothetical protein FE257_006242 [Aspergillus nanangensis]